MRRSKRVAALAIVVSTFALADATYPAWTSIPWDTGHALRLPPGYTFRVMAQEGMRLSDGTHFRGKNDLNAFVADSMQPNRVYLLVNHEEQPGGASVLTLDRDEQGWQVIESRGVDFDVEGVRGRSTWNNCSGTPTPWGTVLSAEEYPPDQAKLAAAAGTGRAVSPDSMDYGWMVEIDPRSAKALRKLEALGRFSHEGAAVLPDKRTVLMAEDERAGLIFKFVADREGELSAGRLYALKLTGDQIAWVEVPAEQAVKADEAGKAAGATPFRRPEDIEYNPVDGLIYIAETGDDRQVAPADQFGRVWRLDLTRNTLTVFVQGDPSGVMNPDNLAIDPDSGDVLIHEDRYDRFLAPTPGMPNNTLWVAERTGRLKRFATLPEGAEVTGGAFAPDGTLFFNVQHPDPPWRSSVIQVVPPPAASPE